MFDGRKFERLASKNLGELEFMARVTQFSNAMKECLPKDVPQALAILVGSLPPPLEGDEVMDSYLLWPYGQFICDYATEHFDAAFPAMVELTQRFSSEFAVRPFVENQPRKTFAALKKLTKHPNYHVRRWCSEGVRPRLPWGKKLVSLVGDPSPILPILEALKDDPERYVQRSVANNLNDIAKDHPVLVVETCERWMKKPTEARKWIVKHALRSLVKSGDPGALRVLGFGSSKGVTATLDIRPKKISMGKSIDLRINLQVKTAGKYAVDYRVYFLKANGKASPKVFKWKNLEMTRGESVSLEKSQTIRNLSTRKLYPGHHEVAVQVNGTVVAESHFVLRE